MDPQSILDQNSAAAAPVAKGGEVLGALDAGAAARFPGEDGGRSLAAMAYRDLDAALQLLAERAQYITGASGAMIALRRGEQNDMLCRASAGVKAPELGALLSMEHGFSGESVRSRQALRCDDAEMDPRVNREGCRRLGISSVVAMPILSDQQVLGVFELFSGEPHAFEERDLSALQRLSEMVETAVKYAVAAQAATVVQEPAGFTAEDDDLLLVETKLEVETGEPKAATEVVDSPAASTKVASAKDEDDVLDAATEKVELAEEKPSETSKLTVEPERAEVKETAAPGAKKPLFWSAETGTSVKAAGAAEELGSEALPAVFRSFRKCQACGFPVSQGRTLCVECEEKQWRGQTGSQSAGKASRPVQPATSVEEKATKNAANEFSAAQATTASEGKVPAAAEQSTQGVAAESVAVSPVAAAAGPAAAQVPAKAAGIAAQRVAAAGQEVIPVVSDSTALKAAPISTSDNSTLFSSASMESQSWLAGNKYIVGALLLVAIIIAAVVLLR